MHQLQMIPEPGSRLRSYDFAPSQTAVASYLEGILLRTHEHGGHLCYEVLCDYCNYIGRAGMTVHIPVQLDHHDFAGRISIGNAQHPQLNLDAKTQHLYLFDTVWTLSKKGEQWLLFQREHPSSHCWSIDHVSDADALWSACVEQIDKCWDPEGR